MQGVQQGPGVSRGVQGRLGGGPGGGPGGSEVLGGKTTTQQYQNFVQEVVVGQMAQGTPFSFGPWPPSPAPGKGKGEVSNTPPKGRRIYIHLFLFISNMVYSGS